jgi:glycosyltransferase involved in cell wall biosynthesis
MHRPLISFVTPTFNSAATVADTIASVEREADGFDYEHLFIDGTSTDGTVELIKNLKGGDALIMSESDEGTYDAMNKGIRRANGEWVAIINSDDYYLPGAVAEMVKAARANPTANVLHGDLVMQFEGKEWIVKPGIGWRGRLGIIHPISHPTMWARHTVYERHGLYNTRYKLASDQEMFFRFLDGHETCIYVPKPITLMRIGGLSTRFYDNGIFELLDIHSSRQSFYGLAAHILFYRQFRLRNHQKVPRGRSYWLWAANDFLSRRFRSTRWIR